MAKIINPQAPTITRLTSTGTTTGYFFTVTSANASVGATYTNNGNTFTVLATIAAGTQLFCSGANAPTSSGTLTKSSGTGDATITFSANQAMATYNTPANAVRLKIKAAGAGGGGAGASNGGNGNNGTATVFGNIFLGLGGTGGAVAQGGGAPGTGGAVTINSPAITLHSFTCDGAYGGGQGRWR